jgi:hypothetical protein
VSFEVLHSDCVEAMRAMPEASVDAIVSDPPYELGFMGSAWDASGIAYSVGLWREALRVLKPGGHLVAFGGTRTYHRVACAIEDAGFEIRDSLDWLYGSGFPKSLDVGRAIDESRCTLPGRHYWHEASVPKGAAARDGDHVCARTELGEAWDGWGTALKPGHEPIVLARKPLAEDATVASNVLEHGTGALNVDGCRVAGAPGRGHWSGEDGSDATSRPGFDGGFTTGGERDGAGRWPPNLLLTHAAECRSAGTRHVKAHVPGNRSTSADRVWSEDGGWGERVISHHADADGLATVTAWECAPGCPVAILDAQSGDTGANAPVKGTEPSSKTDGIFGKFAGRLEGEFYGERGGASRFFPTSSWDPEIDAPFLYCAKPARSERDAGLEDVAPTSGGEATERADGSAGTQSPRAGAGRNGGAKNFHPTVKPIRLMEWLVRLVTPPGGVVLDPFVGSGTTGCAAVRLGFDFIGIEREEPYVQLAVRRIALASGAPRAKAVGELVRLKPPKASEPQPQLGLFGATGTENA